MIGTIYVGLTLSSFLLWIFYGLCGDDVEAKFFRDCLITLLLGVVIVYLGQHLG